MTTIVIGNIPPPVDGAGMVTARAVEILTNDLGQEVELCDCFDQQGRLSKELISYRRAASQLFRRDVKCAYIQGVQGERMLFVLILLVLAKLTSTPVVHHHHAFKFITSPSVLWRLICLSWFDVTHIVLSQSMGLRLESTYGNKNWRAVSNAAFVRQEFQESEQRKAKSEESVVLFAGVAGLGKGEDVLIKAVREVRKNSGHPIRLILAGRGHKSDEIFVETVGVLSPQELASRMQTSTLLALPSRYEAEAAPMVLYEAAACGLASISSNQGCIPEMSAELNGCISVIEPSVASLVSCLEKAISMGLDEEVSNSFSKSQSAALKNFSDVLASACGTKQLDKDLAHAEISEEVA